MAEHFRDFLDPKIDRVAASILHPKASPTYHFLQKYGGSILQALGGQKLPSNSEVQRWRFSGGSSPVTMEIYQPDIVIPGILSHGSNGLFYTYTAEDKPLWRAVATPMPPEIDTGNPDTDSIVVLTEALIRASERPRRLSQLFAKSAAPIRDWRALRRWSMDTGRTKQEIAAHYDIRQDAYVGKHGFLDPLVQYSSGYLRPGQKFKSLKKLQEDKVDELARKLELDSAKTLLEIGGGWGGLAVAIAKRAPHLKITSLTISDEQLKRAKRRAKDARVDSQITFSGKDYREYKAKKPFDRVISVEMIEAVAWQDLGIYLDALASFANPKTGIIALQAITNTPEQYPQHRHDKKNFMTNAIFPDGILHPKETIADGMHGRGWRAHEVTNLSSSYPLTLREWIRNLHQNEPVLTQKWLAEGIPVDKIERFYRGFSFYLAASQAGFRAGRMQDYQMTFRPITSSV